MADLDICTKKERELELIVEYTNDLLFQYQIHPGILEKQALVAALNNGSETIAAMQQCVDQGLHRPQSIIFSSLECLPLPSSQVDCEQYLKTRQTETRLKSATKIQARVRGMLSRMEHSKRTKNAFLLNVQKMMQGSLQRISCRRVVPQEEEGEDPKSLEQDEVMTQASTVLSGVTEDYFKRGAEDFKKGVDDLAQSIHTATTAPLSELSHSAHRSIQGGIQNFVRQVSFRVQDRWKTGVPQREFLFSKTIGNVKAEKEEEEEEEKEGNGKSRWDSGTPRREVMLSMSFR